MAIPVLVVTPNTGFGELVCQIITESGHYALSLSTNKKDAAKKAEDENPALIILETDLNGNHVGGLVDSFRENNPDLLLILITPEGAPEETSFDEMEPDGVLAKPVYLPDLVSQVEYVIQNSGLKNLDRARTKPIFSKPPQHVIEEEEENVPAPEWLSDVNQVAQYLTRLSLESASQASLITKGDQIWAYAGELSRPAAEELALNVAAHFEDGGGSDLARFIRLEETGGEYMLYATGLGGEYVLATVFDAEMPFSKIRSQASNLASALSSPPALEEKSPEEPSLEEAELTDEEVQELWPLLDDIPPPIPEDWVPEVQVEPKQESLLEELLEDADDDSFSNETVAVQSAKKESTKQTEAKPQEEPQPESDVLVDVADYEAETDISRPEPPPETVSELRIDPSQVTTVASTAVQREKTIDETVVSKSAKRRHLKSAELKVSGVEVEPVSPSMYNLTYACVLIPRFPNHHLTGEVAKRLSDWITHLCLAFGWRLEHLSIRPDYMQWLVNVPPNTSPGYLMRTVRQHTSRRMFIEFPEMDEDNPGEDFWAPGYLILGNPQPPPATLVQEFISNTRLRQGLKE